MKKLILFVLTFMLALSFTGYAFAASTREATVYVTDDEHDDSGTTAYATTLREALEKANDYVYDESAFANVTIILQKNDTPDEMIAFDGSNYTDLSSVTITGSGPRVINAPNDGGRHFSISSSGIKLIFSNVTIRGSSEGGGVSISNGEVEFSGVTFSNCTALEEENDDDDSESYTYGGAVAITGSGSATFSGCTFTSNSAGNGGAMYTSSTNAITFTDTNTFSQNNVSLNGGAIYVASGSEIASTGTLTFNNNTADENGGALYVASGGTVSSTGFTFSGNTAGTDGGAIYLAEASGTAATTVTGTFTSNSATSGNGGAIYVSSGNELKLSGTLNFASNGAPGGNGGAIYVTGTGKITNSSSNVTFRENYTSYEEDGEETEASEIESGFGGAVCMAGTETLEFGSVSFISNTSPLGGAVYVSGGTMNFSGSSSWNANKAYDGGAVYSTGGTMNFNGTSTFTANEALDNGGALCVTGNTVAMSFSSTPAFNQNKANADNGSLGDGGAIWWGALTSKFITGGTFNANSTGGSIEGESVEGDAGKGGAIYFGDAGTKETLTLGSEFTFSNNTAFNKGGAIYTNSANLDIVLESMDQTVKNTAQYYNGGFINSARGKITVDGSNIANQQARIYGGAIYGKNIVIKNDSTFENNISELGHGGAVFAGKDSSYVTSDDTTDAVLTVDSAIFRSNKASSRTNGSGGAISASDVEVSINNAYFVENAAGHSGGAVYINQGCTNVTVTSSTFSSNGTDGSQVSAQYGGAIRSEAAITIGTSYFYSNSAQTSGGAIYFARNSAGSAEFNLEYSMFTRNMALGSGNDSVVGGGAIYLDMDIATINSSTFDANVARGSSGVAGGGLFIANTRESTIQNCTFTDNQSTGTDSNGGGMAIAGTARVNVKSCTLTASSLSGGNSAVNMGGGIYVTARGNLAIGGTIVVGNSANYGGDICSLGECSSATLGFNRVGKFSGDSSTGSTSWTAQPNRADSDRSNESWTKETFFTDGSLSENIVDSEKPPFIGSELADGGQVRLLTIMLKEDDALAETDRATNIIDTSYSASFPRYDERGADRWSTNMAMDIGAVMFDGTIVNPEPSPVTSYTVQSITMSGIPNTLRSIGQTASLIALVRYTNGRISYGGDDNDNEPVTWTSSNQNIIRIDQKGNITALAVTPNNSYVTISVSTKRNSSTGSPATDSRPVRVLGQYSYLNVSTVYQNYLAQYIQELAEHDIALSLADVSTSGVKATSFQRAFTSVWDAESANQITDLTTSTPEFNTLTSYSATGYSPSKNAAPNINFRNRSNGDLLPLVYTWNFSGSEIKSLLGYDLSEKTMNANFADELFKSLRIDFQGTGKTFQVIGGSGVSAKDAFTGRVLSLTRADGNKGVKVELTAYLANLNTSGSDDGPQLMGAGSRKMLIVPDGTNDGAITGSMWMLQKGSSSNNNNNNNNNSNGNGNNGSKSSGGGGGGGCNAFNAGLLTLALVFVFKRR